MEKHFSIQESLAFGFTEFKKRPLFFAGVTLISVLISVGFNLAFDLFIQIFFPNIQESIAVGFQNSARIVSFFLSMLVQIGTTRIYLDSMDGKTPVIGDIFHAQGLYFQYVLLSAISSSLILLGYLFFIIPGIILSLMFQFAPINLVDEQGGFAHALRRSKEITHGVRLKLFIYGSVSTLVVIVGVLFFGVGGLIAVPVVTFASTHIYRTLQSQTLS